MRYKNLIVIGTSHIAPESLAEVEQVLRKYEPGIVAIELDPKRLSALLSKRKQKPKLRDIKRIGFKGFLFSLIGAWVEKKLGQQVGVAPGTEMVKAVRIARELGSQVALIDQDIEITLRRFSDSLSWKERGRLLGDILKGIITRKPEITFDLTKVPSQKTIARLIAKVHKRYPNIYRVLVTERNIVMGRNLAHIMLHYPETLIVAIIGAGHEKEIVRIAKQQLDLYRKKHPA